MEWSSLAQDRDHWQAVGDGNFQPITSHEGTEGEKRYSSTLSLTLALDGGGWSAVYSDRFVPREETRYVLYRRLGGPQRRSG